MKTKTLRLTLRHSLATRLPLACRHAVHLERKVEGISAEAYLFQCSRHLFQAIPRFFFQVLKCPWFRRHAVHLERRVEVISAEGYLLQCSRHLFTRAFQISISFMLCTCLFRQAWSPHPVTAAPAHMHLLYSNIYSV